MIRLNRSKNNLRGANLFHLKSKTWNYCGMCFETGMLSELWRFLDVKGCKRKYSDSKNINLWHENMP